MTLRKSFIWTIIIILFFTLHTGCITEKETTFSVLSSKVVDYYGFPSLIINFSSNDEIMAEFFSPNGDLIFNDDFFLSQYTINVPLSSYRNDSNPGVYQLNIYDKNQNQIFNESFQFNNTDLSIESVEGHWWKENSSDLYYTLLGLSLEIVNNGDFPIYPHTFNLSVENYSKSGVFIPGVLLPNSADFINCSLFIDNLSSGEKNCSILVKSKNNVKLIESNFKLTPQENTPKKVYTWNFNGIKQINIPFPGFLYNYYSRLDRLNTNDYAAYVFNPFDDQYLSIITESIFSSTDETDDISKINLVASFIQNLEYSEDDPQNSSYEYPLYPIELLQDIPCDCEDRSILGSHILNLEGYNVSLIGLPKHMAIGVNPNQNLPEYNYYIDEYYFLETTIVDMLLGEVPILYKNISDQGKIYSLNSRPILIHDWIITDGIMYSGFLEFVKLRIIVENNGNEIAENIKITGAFFSEDDVEYNQKTVYISSLLPGDKEQINMRISAPKDISIKLKTSIYLNDVLIEENQSNSTFS